ncbi:hypothetical protein CaCOL14_003428 [Colletotrichum acutatum]
MPVPKDRRCCSRQDPNTFAYDRDIGYRLRQMGWSARPTATGKVAGDDTGVDGNDTFGSPMNLCWARSIGAPDGVGLDRLFQRDFVVEIGKQPTAIHDLLTMSLIHN